MHTFQGIHFHVLQVQVVDLIPVSIWLFCTIISCLCVFCFGVKQSNIFLYFYQFYGEFFIWLVLNWLKLYKLYMWSLEMV